MCLARGANFCSAMPSGTAPLVASPFFVVVLGCQEGLFPACRSWEHRGWAFLLLVASTVMCWSFQYANLHGFGMRFAWFLHFIACFGMHFCSFDAFARVRMHLQGL